MNKEESNNKAVDIEIQKDIINIQKVFVLMATIFMYVLGGGIAKYLGADFHPIEFLLGLAWVISVHISGYLLLKIFSQTSYSKWNTEISLFKSQIKVSILHLSIIFLSFSGVFILILIINQKFTIFVASLVVLILLGLTVFTVPPLSLSNKGYQEIGLAIFQGSLIPALGFFLLFNNLHRILILITFPMTVQALAFYILRNFLSFAADQKKGKKTFVLLFSWQRAAPLHNLLILSSYFFFFIGYSLGIPFSILWVILLTFPLAVLQVYWLKRIVSGGKPLWPIFNILSASVYGLSAYLITFTFWIH